MDLERELRAIELAWPETPELRLELDARRRRSLRRLLVAVALLLVALAAAFAVPQSRGAILRFLHLGGVTIELVERLPAAQERPLGAGEAATAAVPAALGNAVADATGLRLRDTPFTPARVREAALSAA